MSTTRQHPATIGGASQFTDRKERAMRRRRALVLARNYAPEKTAIGPLTADLCEYLGTSGWRVRVIAAAPHYPEWQVFPGYERPRWRTERLGAVTVLRVPIWLKSKPTAARARIAYDLSFALGALWRGLWVSRPDVIICVAPPILAGAAATILARRHRAPLVVIVQDLELQIAAQLQIMNAGRLLRIAGSVERRIFAGANAVSVISEPFAKYAQDGGTPADRVTVIPNWVDTGIIKPQPRGSLLAERCGFAADDRVVLYAGNLGEKQGLEILVLAASALQPHGIHIVLVGDGSAKELLHNLASSINAINVHFLPLQPRADLAVMLASADVLVLVQRPEVVDSVVPSKLLTYMASGRPVVASAPVGSESARHILSATCGLVVTPGDTEALSSAIVDACSSAAKRLEWGEAGRRYAEQHFSRNDILGRYRRLLENVACRR